jgi:hypothetical protein
MKCEIKLCPLLIIDHIESVFQTLLMFFAFAFCIHLFVIIHFMLPWDLFVKLYDECFIPMLMLHMVIWAFFFL